VRASKFDKIAVGEMTVNFMSVPNVMKAKAAFVDSSGTGSTHGWTECTNWSAGTVAKLADLRASMEADLEKVHFDDGTTIPGGKNDVAHDGLGEALGGGVPQG
jgi:hypothetical protein